MPANAEWRPVAYSDFPCEVSNTGLVRRLNGASESTRKIHPRRYYGPRIMQPIINNGYHYVCLAANSKVKRVSVHSLVLMAFVGPRPMGMYGCHKDGDRSNNHISNLKWATPTENQADRVRHGRHQYHIQNGSVKYSLEDVREIKRLRKKGMIYDDIAAIIGNGCNRSYVHSVCTGKVRTKG